MNTRNYMSFAGWTDKAYIYAQATPSCTIARHRGRKILVSGANKYIGETCLVRFGLKESDMEPDPITNFISSNVPETFQGSPPESYIFTALWEFSMKKTGNIPTYREMNQYFEPGSLTWFYYLTKNSSKK